MDWNYDTETHVTRLDSDPTDSGSSVGFDTHLSGAWNIGVNPNGGYAMAPLLRAVGQLVADADTAVGSAPKLDPLTVTAHFLRPSTGDAPANITAELIRAGRRSSTATASLTQAGKERVRLLAAFGDLGTRDGSNDAWESVPEMSIEPVELPPPEECLDRVQLEQGVDLPILSRLEVRIDPVLAKPGSGRAEVAGWIRFLDGRPPDSSCLPLFGDAFPPSLFSLLGRVGWVPTLEFTAQIRRRPEPGWIRARFVTKDLTDGLLVEDGELWDSAGNLVARTRQLAMLLPPGT